MLSQQNKEKELNSKLSSNQISDLIILGRLGNIASEDESFRFHPNGNFQPLLLDTQKFLFLIFPEKQIRYIPFTHNQKKGNYFLRFTDFFANLSISDSKKTQIAILKDDYNQILEIESYDDIIDFKVIYEDQVLGLIQDYFEQGDHYVITIEYKNKELMIPLVEEYLTEIDFDNNTVHIKNAIELLEYAE